MAHGVTDVLSENGDDNCVIKMVTKQQNGIRKTVGVMGSRRIFAPAFKLKVLDSYRNDIDCRGNQRATARKYGIHRRQIQKWLQCEENLRSSCADSDQNHNHSAGVGTVNSGAPSIEGPREAPVAPSGAPAAPALNLSIARLHGDELSPPPAQQGPPLQFQHSPSSPQYSNHPQNNTCFVAIHLPSPPRYPPGNTEFHPNHTSDRNHSDGKSHRYGTRTEDHKYYLLNNNYEIDTTRYDHEAKLYQTLTTYHSPTHCYSQNHHRESLTTISTAGQDSRSQISPVLAIKPERASPDSAATPGTCETVGPSRSPGHSRSPLPPDSLSPHHATSAVHFERTRTSPVLTRTHVQSSSHACVNSRNPHEDGIRVRGGTHPTDRDYSEGNQQPPASVSSAPAQCTPAGSPRLERVLCSSPRSSQGLLSSGRSSTSSDSETDALDYTTTALAPTNDLTRRRSFSLRFKLDVLDAFHRDAGVAGNQRATARKFGINRRQVQKWLSQETELRGEIALRGGTSRQRLGPAPESLSGDTPIDLRTNFIPGQSEPLRKAQNATLEDSYCCYSPDITTSHRQTYYPTAESSDILSNSSLGRPCTLSCCADNVSCYSQESLRMPETASLKRTPSYPSESQSIFSCYSPHDSMEVSQSFVPRRDCSASCYGPEHAELTRGTSSPLKRPCILSCCSYDSSPKRLCANPEENTLLAHPISQDGPQEAPLCLVKPKRTVEPVPQVEPVTSTVPTPPAAPPVVAPTKRDAILFKPYLDNPIAKPTEDHNPSNRSPSNNNNCQSVCNLNDNRNNESYALELSLRVPVSWGTPQIPYSELPQVRSAFVRYPTTPHYT